jgi:hypothetical protein
MDIAKCQGVNCPFQQYCYRFTAQSDENQYYLMAVPYDPEAHDCEFYWKDEALRKAEEPLTKKESRKRKKNGTK